MSPNESIVEDAALIMPVAVLTLPLPRGEELGRGKLVGRLREAIRRLNPATPDSRTLATLRDPATAGLPKLLSEELATSSLSGTI